MNDNETTTAPAVCAVVIGQPLYAEAIGLHWVASVTADDSGSRLLIGGPSPMSAILWQIVAVTSDGRRFTMDEHTAAARAEKGARFPARDDTGDLLALADERTAETLAKSRADHDERERLRAIAAEEFTRYRPAWAKAAIVAERIINKSDSMIDYFGHDTADSVVLAWSTHERDLFPEMRKAAALLPETADLATAPDSAEHREKYSMGGGFYLKAGGRHSDGWRVSKWRGDCLRVPGLQFTAEAKGERPAPSVAAVAPETEASTGAGLFKIEQHEHTKKGFTMWVAVMGERVERERYNELLDAARALGGWYSRAWAGTPAGFAFKVEAKARQFVDEQGGGNHPPAPAPVGPETERKAERKSAPAATGPEKLRETADAMQKHIDDGFRDRLANTPKRARQAAEARNEGTRWERAQKIARALADRIERGDYPTSLARVRTKAELYELAAEEMDRSGGYYDAGVGKGVPYEWPDLAKRDRARDAWALLAPADPATEQAEALRRKLVDLSFAKIPGYFPTPAELVAQMLDRVGDLRGKSVLEPSAGGGAIADALREAGAGFVHCVEHHASLADVLRLKGYSVNQMDFMDTGDLTRPNSPVFHVDAVVMNPPFERGQDCEHVRKAYRYLKPGGVLVAIMGAGVKFRAQNPYASFREWLDERGGEMVDIPAGAFKESGTGVASVMVTITAEG